jgi:hypothetical protein
MLPLDVADEHQLGVFVHAVGDARMRARIRKTPHRELPPELRELVGLLDDSHFLSLTSAIAAACQAGASAAGMEDVVKEKGKEVREYVTTKYPRAILLLERYARSAGDAGAHANLKPDVQDVWLEIETFVRVKSTVIFTHSISPYFWGIDPTLPRDRKCGNPGHSGSEAVREQTV